MPVILIVDDEASVRRILARTLHDKGYEYLEAANAEEARQHLKQKHVDLVLSDIQMPEESGISLLKYIVAEYPDTPVIMVTVFDDLSMAEKTLEIGAFGYIEKPFHQDEVLIQISSALHRRAQQLENNTYQKKLEKQVNERTKELKTTIQKLRETEKSLRENEKKFRNISTYAHDAIVMVDNEVKVAYWNKAATEIFGYSEDEVMGKGLLDIICPPEYYDAYKRIAQEFKQYGSGLTVGKTREFQALKKDETRFPIELSISSVKIKNRWHAIGIIRDITDRKMAEEQIKKANAEIKQLLSSISSILIGVNEKGAIIQWNPAAEKTFGIPSKQAIGKQFETCNIQWQWPKVCRGIKRCKNRKLSVKIDDLRFQRQDGKEGFLAVTISRIQPEKNSYSGFILLGEDVTDRKVLESQLAQAQKLESIGQLAAGIAHEINTPTQYVGDNTRFLRDAFDDLNGLITKCNQVKENMIDDNVSDGYFKDFDEYAEKIDLDYLLDEIPKSIHETLEGVDRVSKIVGAMKEFSHPEKEEKTETDINRAIESTITVSRNEWKYVAEMEIDLDQDLPLVPCLLGEFNQVILNIIVNAAHAITEVVGKDSAEKGRIKVMTRRKDHSVEIQISDTGNGIPEANRSKIFDPFFTTKEVGKGTGQGLAIAHSTIVDKHGGEIGYQTELGKGTTFVIRLPLEDEQNEMGSET